MKAIPQPLNAAATRLCGAGHRLEGLAAVNGPTANAPASAIGLRANPIIGPTAKSISWYDPGDLPP
jgi:hypothetical protein